MPLKLHNIFLTWHVDAVFISLNLSKMSVPEYYMFSFDLITSFCQCADIKYAVSDTDFLQVRHLLQFVTIYRSSKTNLKIV